MKYLLQNGIKKLEEIRREKTNAAGLIVASSVEHATRLFSILSNEFNKNAVLVTYKHNEAASAINHFRHSDAEWIVSVGMVSEGTDIPRLQVCCHLSRVKTELYFRQVLGRILRVNYGGNQEAWLYTFAEPNLAEYANRINQEIPEQNLIIREDMKDSNISPSELTDNSSKGLSSDINFKLAEWNFESNETGNSLISESDNRFTESHDRYFDIVGSFRQQVVDAFK
ncbi:helicase-related protein [Psychromonas ossibalaenae]|uniref:helicase-related protein n=1 Tax=Psychromonas ossibalaenae TaxID=444922 RepID=UPI000365B1D7